MMNKVWNVLVVLVQFKGILMYLVLAVIKTDNFNVTVNSIESKVNFSDVKGLWGFCPVYETKELAECDYPGHKIVQIEKTRV